MKELSKWKKVLETDLDYVVNEMKDILKAPSMVILTGDVGAGKTTLLKNFYPTLDVNSPTYSVVNELGSVVHSDLYRVEDKEEIIHLELSLYLEGKEHFFVEWGRPYLQTLKREIDPDWSLYEIEIKLDDKNDHRDYYVYELDH